jgi:hypothetical protein
MSGSSGNTNAGNSNLGSQGGRAPRHGNENVTARHDERGPQQAKGGSAEEAARGTVTGRNDSRLADADQPEEKE